MESKKPVVKNVLKWIALVLMTLIVALNVFTMYCFATSRDVAPTVFGVGAGVVVSGSMDPTIKVDDLVVFRKEKTYKVGDIVVYQSGNSLVTHRIVEINDDSIVTQGDANNTKDVPISIDNVKGKVITNIHNIGAVISVLQHPITTLIVIILAVALFVLSFTLEDKAIKNKNDEKAKK